MGDHFSKKGAESGLHVSLGEGIVPTPTRASFWYTPKGIPDFRKVWASQRLGSLWKLAKAARTVFRAYRVWG